MRLRFSCLRESLRQTAGLPCLHNHAHNFIGGVTHAIICRNDVFVGTAVSKQLQSVFARAVRAHPASRLFFSFPRIHLIATICVDAIVPQPSLEDSKRKCELRPRIGRLTSTRPAVDKHLSPLVLLLGQGEHGHRTGNGQVGLEAL